MLPEADVARPIMERRLNELRQELSTGEAQLAALDKKRRETGETMLRIAGAIQVLEELLQASPRNTAGDSVAAAPIAANGLQPAAVEA